MAVEKLPQTAVGKPAWARPGQNTGGRLDFIFRTTNLTLRVRCGGTADHSERGTAGGLEMLRRAIE